jgi:arylsulfatase A-like enzyme
LEDAAGVATAWHPRQDRILVSESIDNQDRLIPAGIAPMEPTPAEPAARRLPRRIPVSPIAAVLLAISFGLCGGYLDLGVILFKKFYVNPEGSFRSARDFPWTVPVSHAVLLVIPGVVVASVNRLRPKLVSLYVASWLFATLAIWSALLRMPVYGACSLLLAVGLARPISNLVVARGLCLRPMRSILAAILGSLIVLAALSSGRRAVSESRAVAGLPSPPPRARNVVLIVWDTVRASHMSLYRYQRDTTPNLVGWARKGVRYDRAMAPAPWTFPSHCSFFTGQWPFQLDSQWKYTLDTPHLTLAEYLASRGYQTAGFVANTDCCNYETGLNRGFAHFEDYVLTPRSLMSRNVAGKWILENLLSFGDYYEKKWIGLQSRGAREINGAFLDWLSRRRTDRPFFAFLNYFDAHAPYIAPAGHVGRFGIRPVTPGDYQVLVDFVNMNKNLISKRDVLMARDCYHDCIAFLDEQLGRLLDELQGQGLLGNTDVIITSDHGEEFGEHLFFGHAHNTNLDAIGVPLVILSPRAPNGRVVQSPVSLRDLPATVVDLLGLSDRSPFLGRSLTAYWGLGPGQPPEITSPALTEQAEAAAFQTQPRRARGHPGFQMSLVASGHHYIRHGMGPEQLYDLRVDPLERVNLVASAAVDHRVGAFRTMLLEVLTENRGSVEVEKAYLEPYRKWLEALVQGSSEPITTTAAK